MKKDEFKGKISKEHIRSVKLAMLLFSTIAVFVSIIFLFVGSFCDVALSVRVILFIFAGLFSILAIAYPAVTLCLIRCYPKHKKITKLLLKEKVFNNSEEVVEEKTENNEE